MCAFNYAVVYVCFRRFGSGRLGVFPCNRIGAFAVRFCKNTAGVLGTYGCNRIDKVTDYYDRVRIYQYPVNGFMAITELNKKRWRRCMLRPPAQR